METYLFFTSFLILLCLLTLVIWFMLVKFLEDRESEFVVNYKVMNDIIEIYKEVILSDKINTLRLQYDLNEKSQTNSRRAFETAKNKLISETVKEIIKEYLSKKCLKSLLQHYSIDGLSLLIITHLKR